MRQPRFHFGERLAGDHGRKESVNHKYHAKTDGIRSEHPAWNFAFMGVDVNFESKYTCNCSAPHEHDRNFE